MSRVPLLFAVTDDRVVRLPDFLERARAVACGPDVALLLRATVPARVLLTLADALRTITATSGARLLLHDRLDVARLCGADGVHLPGRGLPVPAVRRLLGAEPLVGGSPHAAAEARPAAADGADYAFIGPVWPTASPPGRPPLGPQALRAARPAPVVAIGGVTAVRAADARAGGAAAASRAARR